MGFCHPLINHGPAAAADQIAEPAAQESVLLVGHQRLTVLPAQAQIVAPAVLAPLDWDLVGCHGHPSSATQHTTETGNIQGKWAEFRESYHLEPLLALLTASRPCHAAGLYCLCAAIFEAFRFATAAFLCYNADKN
mgnify:CR=1 FL=1